MLHARPPLVAHCVPDRQARGATLTHVVVVGAFAFVWPSIREQWLELGEAAAQLQLNDRRHVHVGHRDVDVKAADEREPVGVAVVLSGVRDALDRVFVRPAGARERSGYRLRGCLVLKAGIQSSRLYVCAQGLSGRDCGAPAICVFQGGTKIDTPSDFGYSA